MAETLDDKIDKVVDKHQTAINKTPRQRRKEKLDDLYDKLLKARDTYESAPLSLKQAEQSYYKLKNGDAGYNKTLISKFKDEAQDVKQEMLAKHETDMNNAFQALAYYNSQRTYTKNINVVKLSLLEGILAKIKEIQKEYNSKNTNNRKTFYMAQEQEFVTMCLQVVNYAMLSFIVVYIIYSVKEQKITKFTYIFVIGLVIIHFYLEKIIDVVKSIPLSFNVYTAWGEDTDKTSFAFWAFFMIALFLFGVIYANNNEINNYFQ